MRLSDPIRLDGATERLHGAKHSYPLMSNGSHSLIVNYDVHIMPESVYSSSYAGIWDTECYCCCVSFFRTRFAQVGVRTVGSAFGQKYAIAPRATMAKAVQRSIVATARSRTAKFVTMVTSREMTDAFSATWRTTILGWCGLRTRPSQNSG